MLRKFPPEKAPEEFKKIREAYERLIDPISRAEYDAYSQYKEQIDELENRGNEALEKEDYKSAIREFKKILIIEPNLTFAKNRLGLALTYDGQYDAAITQFETLTKISPSNATFHSNLAFVYKEKKEYVKAKQELIKAYELDPISDSIILELAHLYMNMNQFNDAVIFLRSCIGKNSTDKFQDFIYYFEMVKVYILAQEMQSAEKVIDEIEGIIPDDKEAHEYAAWMFAKLAFDFYKANIYYLAEKISQRALNIAPNNEDIKKIYEDSKKNNELLNLCNKLLEDNRIIEPLKGPILYYLHSSEYEEAELKENISKNLDAIQTHVDYDFVNLINSIEIYKKNYRELYECHKDFFDTVYKLAKENKLKYEQYEKFRDDVIIVNGIKRLIALWMSEDISDSDRDKFFYDIMLELDNEKYSKIISSIDRIKMYYSELYKLNPDTLQEFKNIVAKKNGNTSTGSTGSFSNNTNTSNGDKTQRTSNSSSTTSNNNTKSTLSGSESSKSGCGIVLICAIIGAFIIPGVGFFIGGFIGLLISSK